MTYLILFEDAASAPPDLRQRHMKAHLAFLTEHQASITAAGPLHEADGTGAGGAWLVSVDSPQQAQDLITADPFYPAGLRKSWRILRWTQVFPPPHTG